jgi:hypothetical protein
MARARILHLLEDQMDVHLHSRGRMADGLGLLCFAATLLLLAACGSREVPLPQSIGVLRLEKLQAGEEARRGINRLHGKQIGFQRGYIGFYAAENGRAQLWLSEHSSSSEAAESVEKMAGRMTQGEQQVFLHFRQMIIEERKVYSAVGMGQVHYFFQKGAKVIWLAVDPPLAKETIRDAVRKF